MRHLVGYTRCTYFPSGENMVCTLTPNPPSPAEIKKHKVNMFFLHTLIQLDTVGYCCILLYTVIYCWVCKMNMFFLHTLIQLDTVVYCWTCFDNTLTADEIVNIHHPTFLHRDETICGTVTCRNWTLFFPVFQAHPLHSKCCKALKFLSRVEVVQRGPDSYACAFSAE